MAGLFSVLNGLRSTQGAGLGLPGRFCGGGELPEFDAGGGGVERWVEGPTSEPLVDGVDEDGVGGGPIADPVLRALGARPLHRGLGRKVDVGDDCRGGDSAGVDEGVLGDEGDLADEMDGYRRVRRDVVVDEEGEVFGGLTVYCFVADEGTDGDDADGEGCGEGGEVEEAGGAWRGLEGEPG